MNKKNYIIFDECKEFKELEKLQIGDLIELNRNIFNLIKERKIGIITKINKHKTQFPYYIRWFNPDFAPTNACYDEEEIIKLS